MAWLSRDAVEPSADGGKCCQIKVATMGKVRIGVERDVGDGVAARGKIAMSFEVVFHNLERAIAFLHPVIERVLLQFAPAFDKPEPEIGRAEVRLEAVLLEEHPLQRFGTVDA